MLQARVVTPAGHSSEEHLLVQFLHFDVGQASITAESTVAVRAVYLADSLSVSRLVTNKIKKKT